MTTTATKKDITELGTELRGNMKELRAEFKGEMGDLRAEFKGEMGDLRAELKSSFEDVTSLLQTFIQQVDERFNRVESEHEAMRTDISRIFDYLDSIVKKQQISDDERLVMGHQLERLDRWTHELAKKIGYKLKV